MNVRTSDPAGLLQLPPGRRLIEPSDALAYLSALHYSLADAVLIASTKDIRCLKDIAVEPYLHQVENLKQFVNHHQPRMMLFDEVGLGKTITTGLILAELARRRRITNFLIVCPGILIEQWKEELQEKFRFRDILAGKWADIAEALGRAESTTLKVITTYDAVRTHSDFFQTRSWDFVVADEGDLLARLYTANGLDPSQRAKVFYDLLRQERVAFFLLLTATPLRKNLWQVFSLSELSALPGMNPLGTSRLFARTFIEGDPQAALRLKGDQQGLFRKRLGEISVRTTRSDLRRRDQLLFPDRRVENIRVPLDPQEDDLIKSYQRFLLQRCNLYQNIDRDQLRDMLTGWLRPVLSSQPASWAELTRISDAVSEALGEYRFKVADDEGVSFETNLSYRLVSESFLSFARDRFASVESTARSFSTNLNAQFDTLADQFFAGEVERKRRLNRLEEINMAQSVLSSPAAAERAFSEKKAKALTGFERDALEALAGKAAAIGEPQKAKRLLEMVRGLAASRPDDFRLLVFTGRRATQDYLVDYLEKNGFAGKVCRIRGGVPPRENKKAQDDFNGTQLAPGPGYGPPRRHILISTDAGAVGVNLQACNTMVNYDLPWVPTALEQRIGRIQRLGQTAQYVLVNNLFISSSLEETILGRLFERLQLFSLAIGELEQILKVPDSGVSDSEQDFDEWVLKLIELQAQGRDEELSRRLEAMNRASALEELRSVQEENDQLLGSILSSGGDPQFARRDRPAPELDVRAFSEAAFRLLGQQVRFENAGKVLSVSEPPSPGDLFSNIKRFVFEDPGSDEDGVTQLELLAEGTKAFVGLVRGVRKRGGVIVRSCRSLEHAVAATDLVQRLTSSVVNVVRVESEQPTERFAWRLTWLVKTSAARDHFEKLLAFFVGEQEGDGAAIARLETLTPQEIHGLEAHDGAGGRPAAATEITRELEQRLRGDVEISDFSTHYEKVGREKTRGLREWHVHAMREVFGAARARADEDLARRLDALEQEYAPAIEASIGLVEGFAFRQFKAKRLVDGPVTWRKERSPPDGPGCHLRTRARFVWRARSVARRRKGRTTLAPAAILPASDISTVAPILAVGAKPVRSARPRR